MQDMEHNLRLLTLVILLNSACVAANVQDSLVGVEHETIRFSVPVKVETLYGSGICIDQKCSVIATACHIQMAAGRGNLAVAGGHTSKVLSLANKSDSNKTDVSVRERAFSLNIANDVSFVYTKEQVPHKSGVSYSYHYHVGQKVLVAGYYHRKFTTEEAHIIGADVLLEMGTSRLRDDLVLDIGAKQGQSGSAVLDEQGRLIGMLVLTGAVKTKGTDIAASVALPVRTIARALVRLDPSLGMSVFDNIVEGERVPLQSTFEVYKDNDSPDDTSVFPVLTAAASEVSDPVAKLRAKAAVSANLLTNFLAKQCVTERTERFVCHEVGIVQDQQIYREIKRNGELGVATTAFPKAERRVWTEGEWLYTLSGIAENIWIFQGVVKDRYLFSFMSSPEDDRCVLQEWAGVAIPIFGRRHQAWEGSVACFERILTDKDFNVLSVFSDLRPPEERSTEFFQTAIYYDWVELKGARSPIPFPTEEIIVAKLKAEKQLRYGNVTWTEYRKYRASHRIGM